MQAERLKYVNCKSQIPTADFLFIDRISDERMILVLFKNPSQRILPIYHVAAKAELARRGGCRRVAVCTSRGQRSGYNRSLFHHGLGRGCGVGRGLGDGVDLGVTVGVGVAIGVGLGVTVE